MARDEAAAAWDHLRAAAGHGRRRIGATTRHTGDVARERASNAARALRGERPASPWRWLGLGLAAGAAASAAVVAVLARRQEATKEQVREVTDTVKEKANTAVDTIRERTTAAAHRAADTARDTASRLRRHGNGDGDGQEPDRPDGTEPLREPDPHATVK
jgi:hypothetical protein